MKPSFVFILLAAMCTIHPAIGESSLDQISWIGNNSQKNNTLSCGYTDNQWYQQSGKDFFGLTKVESQTLFVQADDFNGQNNGTHIATGSVTGYKNDQTFFSDWLIYNQQQDRASMGDNIYLTRQYDAIQGKWADYFIDLNKGTFTQARAYYGKDNITFTGDQINVLDKNHANIDNGFITSCNPNNPDWYIKADKLNVDYSTSTGEATNAKMYFESIPIFAAPYMTFPLGQRKSGWLTPNVGNSSNTGFFYSEGYYLNLAPNYDMTITPTIWASQGVMIADEFRYMTEQNSGKIYTEQLAYSWSQNQGNPSYRWYWDLENIYNPFKDFTMGYDYNVVSDSNYFNNFGNFYSIVDNVNLDQSAYINYAPSWGLANIKVQNYQTLYPLGYQQTVPIYSQYPAATFNINQTDIGAGFNAGVNTSYTYFYNDQLQSGQRAIVYPSATYPMQKSWGSLTPKIGFNSTQYNIESTTGYPNSGSAQLNLPIASIDGSLYFDRAIANGKNSMTQTLEPRLYYLYIPATNQANLPLFDTSTATYNYSQLFSENQFIGSDRINAANDLTFGLSNKLINDTNGNEVYKLNLAYRYFITPQESDSFYGNYNLYPQLYLPKPNAIAELSNQWTHELSSFATFQYDTTQGNIDYYAVNMKWNPSLGKVINAGFSYQYQMPLLYYAYTPGQAFQPVSYENQYALNLSGQWPIINNKVYAVGRGTYDFTRESLLNIIGGLEYNGGCYSISAVYQQYVFNYNQTQTNYMLNFNFRGIGNVGSGDQTGIIQSNVPGYSSILNIMQNQNQY